MRKDLPTYGVRKITRCAGRLTPAPAPDMWWGETAKEGRPQKNNEVLGVFLSQ